ncbi:MAG: hypothetical protein GY861_00110 [bacterium]|nr:hypothetical protein [bacterium]
MTASNTPSSKRKKKVKKILLHPERLIYRLDDLSRRVLDRMMSLSAKKNSNKI